MSTGKVTSHAPRRTKHQMVKNINHTMFQMRVSPLNIGLSRKLILRGLALLAHKYGTINHFSSPKITKVCLDNFFKVLLILNKSSISPLSRKTILEGLQLLAHQNAIEEEAWYGLLVITSSHSGHPPQGMQSDKESRLKGCVHG